MKKIIVLLILVLFLTSCNTWYWKESTKAGCVKEKWIKGSTDSQKYLIGLESGDVLQITDSIMKWQWRSSDIYNSIDEKKCYDFTVFGWRNGFLSMYPVILKAEAN